MVPSQTGQALRSLRAETRPPGANGHRQITLLHRGPVRLVLFAFDGGGRMPQHQAQGWVTIHVMRGVLRVKTPDAEHVLNEGQLLALAPNIRHDDTKAPFDRLKADACG